MIRVGVVGTGHLGSIHARILTEMPDVVFAGFVEPAEEGLARLKERVLNPPPRFDSPAALAREVDCAVVATSTSSHYVVARELLENGCDVLVEKPITADPDEARQLVELATKRMRVLQVGHSERYHPAVTAVTPLVKHTRYFEAERLAIPKARSLDIDVLFDLMIHDLDLVLALLKDEVKEVRAVGVPVKTGKVDMAKVWLEFSGGAVANLTASRVSPEGVRKMRFFSGDSYISVDTSGDGSVKGEQLDGSKIDVKLQKKEPLRAELEDFVSCVRTRAVPIVSGEDGLRAVELAARVGAAIDAGLKRWKS